MITKMSVNQVGVFGFAETNHRWNPVSNRIFLNRAKNAIQNESGTKTNLTIQTAACTGWLGGEYQAGGTCTGALEGWETRISKREEDPAKLGRWSSIRIQLKGIEINFITAYRVNKSNINLENNTAYAQQWKEMTYRGIKNADPRKQTIDDLKKYIKSEIENKIEIVLMIDANESSEKRTEEMNEMIQECHLIDPHLMADPFGNVETYARGSKKIDFIFTTPRIYQSVTYTQICPYHELIESDHRALIIDLDPKSLELGDITYWKRPERQFSSTNKRSRIAFVTNCDLKAKKLMWKKRLDEIGKERDTTVLEKKLNDLDKEVTDSLICEANKLMKKPQPPRSEELNRAILNHQLWRLAMKSIRTRRCFRTRINQIAKKLNLQEDQEEWKQPRVVASRLREANKVRKKEKKKPIN
jgi:hypothetical protein